jgi:outer membrane protein insertion porin family
MKRKT